MKNIFKTKDEINIDYKENLMYLLIFLVIGLSSTFLCIYILFAPSKPAIIIHILYILFHVLLLYLLKKKFYTFVKLGILITFIIQLTLGVYLWFPVSTGYNLFYYMVPIAAFLSLNINNLYERYFAIFLSFLSTLLFIGSIYFNLDFYMYDMNADVIKLIHILSVVSTIIPGTIIFYIYTLNLSKKQSELRYLANTDSLTKVTNRRVLFENGEKEVFLAQKYFYEFTLIQLDIDKFKDINDSYGHPVGDEVLIQLTNIIRTHIRIEDTFSRHGGEEFAIIVRKTTYEEGLDVAEKIRQVIE